MIPPASAFEHEVVADHPVPPNLLANTKRVLVDSGVKHSDVFVEFSDVERPLLSIRLMTQFGLLSQRFFLDSDWAITPLSTWLQDLWTADRELPGGLFR